LFDPCYIHVRSDDPYVYKRLFKEGYQALSNETDREFGRFLGYSPDLKNPEKRAFHNFTLVHETCDTTPAKVTLVHMAYFPIVNFTFQL